tara:strand:- start:3497 stop:4603 length:1107 start_codon:yes stop_codon:yes gene_type:complete
MATNQITFFAVDNGDAVLLEAHGWTVMTDIKYRAAAADENNEEVNDFAPIIRDACGEDRLDLFVLTHPDEDHLLGFGAIFHLGPPDERDEDPDDGDTLLIVNEIWCSEYAADPNYTTSTSKPLLDEIARRKRLQGTAAGDADGNRLRILSASNGAQESLANGLSWRLLAPTSDEADIPKAAAGDTPNSSNASCLVIQWSITVAGRTSRVLLGGDSTVEVWERIEADYSDDQKNWNILLAPHHCSRRSMGRGSTTNGSETFEWSDDAIDGLDHPTGSYPYVVSSSSKFNQATPPNPRARERYYKILARGGTVTDEVRSRFLVTAGKQGEDAEDIVFKFTASGPTRAIAGTAAAASSLTSPASSGGGGYG